MSGHLLCCIDTITPAGDGEESITVTGWYLSTRVVESVLAVARRNVSGSRVLCGTPRPDVASAYPGYPGADRCGFSFDLPQQVREVSWVITTRGRLGLSQRHAATIYLEPGRVQRIDLARHRRSRHQPATLEQELRSCLKRGPGVTLRLDLVNRCNLRCVMCHYSDPAHRRQPRREIDLAAFRGIFEELAPIVGDVMLSCADEPLLAPDLPEILTFLSDNHPLTAVSFCTNGTLLDDSVRRMLIKTGVARIVVSLDGVSRRTVEGIRIGAAYDRVVGNLLALDRLKQQTRSKRPVIALDFVMMSSNIHEAPRFVELAAAVGAQSIDFRHVIPSVVFSEPEQLLTSQPARFNHYRRLILRQGRRHRIAIVVPPSLPAGSSEVVSEPEVGLRDLDDVSRLLPPQEPVPPDPTRPHSAVPDLGPGPAALCFADTFCARPFSEITILDQELVKPCPFYDGQLARLSDGGSLREVFFGHAFGHLRQNMLRREGDAGCQACPLRARLLATERHERFMQRLRRRLRRSLRI